MFHSFQGPHPHLPNSALLAMTGEPWGTARIPLPPKSLSQFLLLPPLSHPPPFLLSSPSCTLCSARWRCEAEGGALLHRLSCLPFYCFGEDLVLFSSQSFSFLPSSIVTDPTSAPPLCLVAVHTAGPQHPWKGQREKESAGSVGSLVIFLLFFFFLIVRLFFFCRFNFSSAGMTWKAPSWKGSVWSAFFFHSSADPPSASGFAAKSIFPCV